MDEPTPNPPGRVAARIAVLARLYRLLADRPEFFARDASYRIDAAWRHDRFPPLPPEAKFLVVWADDIDRMCAHAVRVLSERPSPPLFDVLGMLDPERVVAMYFALPKRRRFIALRDPVWAWQVQQVDEEAIEQEIAFWDAMPADIADPDHLAEREEMFQVGRESARRQAGLSDDTSEEEFR